jgi:RimJ/RimL family protein N-acetyltransferase
MKKRKIETEEDIVFRPGGTDRAMHELAQAAHRLTVRRIRDSLPGKIPTKRLVLRAPIRGDVPELVRLADNKTIADRMVRLPHPYTRADAIGFVEIFALRADERPYAITLGERLIGVVVFTFVEGEHPALGYWLGEPFWGQGYMTEAARALIEAAYRTPYFETIAARALSDNEASLRVLGKLGFKRVAIPRAKGAKAAPASLLAFELGRPRWM